MIKLNSFLFLLFFFPFITHAQLEFGEEEFLSEVSDANIGKSALSADMDGDGDNDVVATSLNGPIWYKNMDGEGNFSEKILTSAAYRSYLLRLADLDGDHDIDIIFTSFYAGISRVHWLKNIDGKGHFEEQAEIDSSLDEPTSLVVSDLDGDGDSDLAIADNDLTLFAWYLSTGQNPKMVPSCLDFQRKLSKKSAESAKSAGNLSTYFTPSMFCPVPRHGMRI